jgi:hypothetical protein
MYRWACERTPLRGRRRCAVGGRPEEQHRWHADKEGKIAVSRTVIQEEIMTKSAFYKLCPLLMLIYIQCVLKICNEAVVEGMCSVVAKHAHGTRGLIFYM